MEIDLFNWFILFCVISAGTATGILITLFIDEWKHK